VPIIGIGLYPRLVTDSYRAAIEALVDRESVALVKVGRPPVPAVMAAGAFGNLPPALLHAPALG
jgi:NAD(P)H-quinone oxidoreductase subunit 4